MAAVPGDDGRVIVPTRTVAAVAALVGAAVACGGSTMTESPGDSPSTAPGSAAPNAAMTIVRTGGIAGLNDTVEIAADGTAQVTRRAGATAPCTPDPSAVARLRTIDLAAVGTAEPEVPVADGFTYVVAMDAATASGSDGVEGPQAELLAAAGAVVDSCIQSMGSPAS